MFIWNGILRKFDYSKENENKFIQNVEKDTEWGKWWRYLLVMEVIIKLMTKENMVIRIRKK